MNICLSETDANVSLEQDEYIVAEEDGNVTVCAVLTGGILDRAVAVNVSTSQYTALGKIDSDIAKAF